MALRLKRVYEPPSADDGVRILVDRVWPRGITRTEARIDEWLRELGPTTQLRAWFGHDPARWEEFRERYRSELAAPEQQQRLAHLRELAAGRDLTLVYGARDTEHNQAVVLAEELHIQ